MRPAMHVPFSFQASLAAGALLAPFAVGWGLRRLRRPRPVPRLRRPTGSALCGTCRESRACGVGGRAWAFS
eukprot:11156468-Lingulodinium_polyedra.AAC.1